MRHQVQQLLDFGLETMGFHVNSFGHLCVPWIQLLLRQQQKWGRDELFQPLSSSSLQ